MSVPVTVNFNVNVDASGVVNIFGETYDLSAQNVVVAEVDLSANLLYKGDDNGLIHFWEPEGEQHTTHAVLFGEVAFTTSAGADVSGTFTGTQDDLRDGFNKVINGSFDCSEADPFSAVKYENKYNIQTSFGRLALSTYADQLLGHIAATDAITNDVAFIDGMNAETGAGAAQIGTKLAAALFSNVQMTKDNCSRIANQVLGQDASRAMDEDNNQLAPGMLQALEFRPGDIIFVQVKIVAPTVILGTGQGATDIPDKYTTEKSFSLKITLS